MKSFMKFSLSLLLVTFSTIVLAQDKTEKIKVWGECGMCKSKIEKAAKGAGASFAEWNADNKELKVTYTSTSSNTAKIEKAVAAVGYDTKNVRATDESYSKLHGCCKYERAAATDVKASCCKDCSSEKCADCCKDGKCTDCCKDGKCEHGKACTKEGKCEHHDEKGHAAHGDHGCCKKA